MSVLDVSTVLIRHLTDPASSWSIGSFGAIAEFFWDAGETGMCSGAFTRCTARGAIRLEPRADVMPVCYETLSGDPERWHHGIDFCLPRASAAMHGRQVVTEVGLDARAMSPGHREGVLFDMGLALPHVDVYVRSHDPELTATLRRGCGRDVLEPDSPVMRAVKTHSPHRVFVSPLGRIEVYQAIPVTVTPTGPHTHVLPALLAVGRTHSANTPIPVDWLPCLTLYPPHPISDALGERKPFDAAQHAAFQELLAAWGLPEYLDEKRRVALALSVDTAPEAYDKPVSRLARTALRNALRQQMYTDGHTAVLARWRERFDALHEARS